MELIRSIRIKHFKSLEDVEIKGCRRYNLFVGRPNVGKSNLLESLSLLALPYMGVNKSRLGDWLRLGEVPSLFWNGDVSKPVQVETYSGDDETLSRLSMEYRGVDALKRLIYYKAAVYSNTGSLLTLEEPEAHAYPPYIVDMVWSVIDSPQNQYFITTHSPYVVNEFLENKTDVPFS